MTFLFVILFLLGTFGAWFAFAFIILRRQGWVNLYRDVHGIFEGDDDKDSRLSFGRIFCCFFLICAFLLIAYTVYRFMAGAGWQIFVGSGIAVVAALVPYLITKASELVQIITAFKTIKGN